MICKRFCKFKTTAPWSNGRTAAFEAVYFGSNPDGASYWQFMHSPSRWNPNADLIRVVAMSMVIMLHTVLSFSVRPDFFGTKIYVITEIISACSKTSVLLFFILSGYLVIDKQTSSKKNTYNTLKKIVQPAIESKRLLFKKRFAIIS